MELRWLLVPSQAESGHRTAAGLRRWADVLTWARVGATPLVMGLWLSPGEGARWAGTALFVAAGLTDWLDGRLARRSGLTSAVGTYLDPVADKILVLGGALAQVAAHQLSPWWAFGILVRELAVTGLRAVLPPGRTLPASPAAKWKTTWQMAALASTAVSREAWTFGLWAVAMLLTLGTGAQYFVSQGAKAAAAGRAGSH